MGISVQLGYFWDFPPKFPWILGFESINSVCSLAITSRFFFLIRLLYVLLSSHMSSLCVESLRFSFTLLAAFLKLFFFSLHVHSSSNHVFLGNVFLVLGFFLFRTCRESWSRHVNFCAHSVAGEVESSALRDATLLQKSIFENVSASFSTDVCISLTGVFSSSSISSSSSCIFILSSTSSSRFFESIFSLPMWKEDPGFVEMWRSSGQWSSE